MSILSNHEITPGALLTRGFRTDGWGSPHTRETRNTTMYELFIDDDWDVWSVKYFPPEFDGLVTPFGYIEDMRGKILMQRESGHDNNKYIIEVMTMTDIEVFIEQVLNDKIEPSNYEHFNRACRS